MIPEHINEAAVYYAALCFPKIGSDLIEVNRKQIAYQLDRVLSPDKISRAFDHLLKARCFTPKSGDLYWVNTDNAITYLWRQDDEHQPFFRWLEEKLRDHYIHPAGLHYQYNWRNALPRYEIARDSGLTYEALEQAAQHYFAPTLTFEQLEIISRGRIYFPFRLPDEAASILDWAKGENS